MLCVTVCKDGDLGLSFVMSPYDRDGIRPIVDDTVPEVVLVIGVCTELARRCVLVVVLP